MKHLAKENFINYYGLVNKKKYVRLNLGLETKNHFIHGSFCFSHFTYYLFIPHMLNDVLLHEFCFFRLNETVSSLDNIPSLTNLSSRAILAFIYLKAQSNTRKGQILLHSYHHFQIRVPVLLICSSLLCLFIHALMWKATCL